MKELAAALWPVTFRIVAVVLYISHTKYAIYNCVFTSTVYDDDVILTSSRLPTWRFLAELAGTCCDLAVKPEAAASSRFVSPSTLTKVSRLHWTHHCWILRAAFCRSDASSVVAGTPIGRCV